MQRKKLVQKTAALLSAGVISLALATSAFAHVGDYHSGQYLSGATCNQSNLKFRVESSARNSILTSAVYSAGTQWNNISTEVNVSVVMAASGMPTTGFYTVYGTSYDDGTYGELISRNAQGKIVSMDSNWYMVEISMNNNTSAFANSNAARRTFIHEVGHALKLKHPSANFSLSGHTYYGGVPKAIMNSGPASSSKPWIATAIEENDEINLIGKWGS